MKKEEETWDVCEDKPKNFKCKLTNEGFWRFNLVYGKTLLLLDKKGNRQAPTLADQENFITGILEAERRNDLFEFEDNTYSVILSADTNVNVWVENKTTTTFDIRRSYAGNDSVIHFLALKGSTKWWEDITA